MKWSECQRRAKSRAAARRRREKHRARHTPAFLTVEGKLKQIQRHCVAIFNEIHGVEFDDDCREILTDTVLQAGLTR